jgi:hypothetical protein
MRCRGVALAFTACGQLHVRAPSHANMLLRIMKPSTMRVDNACGPYEARLATPAMRFGIG